VSKTYRSILCCLGLRHAKFKTCKCCNMCFFTPACRLRHCADWLSKTLQCHEQMCQCSKSSTSSDFHCSIGHSTKITHADFTRQANQNKLLTLLNFLTVLRPFALLQMKFRWPQINLTKHDCKELYMYL